MNIYDNLNVSWTSIEELAITCHALDFSVRELLSRERSILDNFEYIKEKNDELFVKNFISLAIYIRFNLDKFPNKDTAQSFIMTSFLYEDDCDPPQDYPAQKFNIRFVCNKIIHADKIERLIETNIEHACTRIIGKQNTNGREVTWALDISTPLFLQGVLNWINCIKKTNTI